MTIIGGTILIYYKFSFKDRAFRYGGRKANLFNTYGGYLVEAAQ